MQAGLARPPTSWHGTPATTPRPKTGAAPGVYRRHRPETTALYEVVRDNIETLLAAIDDGALAFRIPRHAREELLAYLDCGLPASIRICTRSHWTEHGTSKGTSLWPEARLRALLGPRTSEDQ